MRSMGANDSSDSFSLPPDGSLYSIQYDIYTLQDCRPTEEGSAFG